MSHIRILIADDIAETRSVIKKILNFEKDLVEVVGEASNGEEVLKLIPKLKPDVVLMDINMPVLNGLKATEKITNDYPSLIVIIMSVQGENEYLKKAMFYGAKEYIIKPFNYETLVETIRATYEKYKDKQAVFSNIHEAQREGKLVTFFSSKGGAGKSVLALNSAIVLSKEYKKKVLVVDLDLQFGDISILVNQSNQKTILDAVDDGQLDSYEGLRNYLYKYSEGLDMLFAPGKPEAAEYIGKESIEKLIKTVKNKYDFIIFDTGVNFCDTTLFILDSSSVVLFISTMEISSLKNTKLGIRVMQSLGYGKDKIKLVINKFTTDYGISRKDVEEAFNDSIFASIPNDEKIISSSVNKGQPFCEEEKYNKSRIVKSLELMCKNML